MVCPDFRYHPRGEYRHFDIFAGNQGQTFKRVFAAFII